MTGKAKIIIIIIIIISTLIKRDKQIARNRHETVYNTVLVNNLSLGIATPTYSDIS